MIFKSLNIKSAVRFSALLSAVYLLLTTLATAQQAPELMVTWKSDNYAPSAYQGKILPIDGSKVEVALELIDGSKIANISGKQINWLINNDELKSGIGLKNISFVASGRHGDQVVEITIKNYKGSDLEKRLEIPLASPELIITGGPSIFEATPYFFNVKNIGELLISWSANSQPATGLVDNPAILEINTSDLFAGSEVVIKVTARNSKKATEGASKTIIFRK
ncbi:MAG: hypothetical protein AAB389_02745 [Patescibacteria group bacterium]|mgnify:CR=1 FL=1